MDGIPSHRSILTTLANSLSQCPPKTNAVPSSTAVNVADAGTSDRHALLLTLHVLFPEIVLPALDLLDRNLVVRYHMSESESERHRHTSQVKQGQHDAATPSQPTPLQPTLSKREIPSKADRCYVVKSLASTMARRGRDPMASSKSYIVHLEAWNCSCASFMLDTFCNEADAVPKAKDLVLPSTHASAKLPFGGMSRDRLVGGVENIPFCKHLMACLLAESWNMHPRIGVLEQCITKEELAAVAGGS